MPSGTGITDAAGAATFSAKPPHPGLAMTRSPTATSVTPGPSALTTPATSAPGENGSGGLNWYMSWIIRTSGKLMAQAWMSMTIWPSPATGSSTSSSTSDSGGPKVLHKTARTNRGLYCWRVMDELGHPVFDGDNHYYEAEDAFTRHLDPALGPRCVQWATIDGRKYHVVGGRVSRAVTNATFDPISKPGCLYEYFRGTTEGVNPLERLRDHEPIRDEYRHPEARLRTLDEQGLAGCWLFPTLGMLYEELLHHDPEAVGHTFRAFNRWLLDDWSFNADDRIFAAPYIALADPQWAVDELEWAAPPGPRLVVMRAAATTTVT